jgi:hypothetical protein
MTSSRCTGAVALLVALALFSFETGHVATASSLPSAAVQATQSHPKKLRAAKKQDQRKRREQQDQEEGQVENDEDGYNGYGGYNAYNGSDTLTFRGTGFGKKWNEFFGNMKSWGKNHSSSLSDASSSTQDSSYVGNSSDYGRSYGSTNWEDYQGMQNGDVGFGMTNYNFMYTGCSNVALNSQDGQLQYSRYAMFRLCPASTCSDNTFRGCNQNYGEYVVRMDEFLAAMVGFNNERMTGFCEYCQECADIEAFNLFFATILGNKKASLTRAQNHYNDWYKYHYSANNGNSNSNSDSNSAQIKYFKMMRSNTYTYDSSGSSYISQSVGGYSSDNAEAWQSMQQGAGTWYGHPIVNGYYDGYGYFNTAWGYVSGYGGNFINLEDASITWDRSIYGQLSENWDEDWLEGGAMLEQCKSSYMEGCRNEYESCLEFLTDEEDYENYQTSSSLKQYLECSAVDMDAYADTKQKRQQYEKNVREQQQGYYEENVECDDGDENCAEVQDVEEEGEYDQLYIGPHCGDDTFGISLAVYTDEYCSRYHSETVEEVLGTSVNEAEINFFPQQCLSCVSIYSCLFRCYT